VKDKNKLVECKGYVDTVGIKCADLKNEILFHIFFTAFRVSLVKGKATDRHGLARMIRKIEMLGDWYGCVLVISFNEDAPKPVNSVDKFKILRYSQPIPYFAACSLMASKR